MTEDFNNSELYFDMDDDNEDIIELTDDDGNVEKFRYIATVPYENEEYVLLTSPDDDSDEYEVVILQIAQDENGEDIYVTCEDEDTSQKVFDLFKQMLEDDETGN